MGCQILATLADSRGCSLIGDIIPGRGHHLVECVAFLQAPTSPQDSSHHSVTGARVHEPLKLYTVRGPVIPLLYQMQRQNETLSSVVLKVYPSPDTHSVPSYTLRLTGAKISKIAPHSSTAALSAQGVVRSGKQPDHDYVEINFTYDTISGTWNSGKKSMSDNWLGK